MITHHVNVSSGYDVLIDDGLLSSVAALIAPVCQSGKVAVITDGVVDALYGGAVAASLRVAGFDIYKHIIGGGESAKNVLTLSAIWEFLAENGFTRGDTLIALGGGVVGDVTGFAAATYMRGVSFIQIPTTLLAAVDASVGGKTAIDLVHGKNLAGAFWQPSLVICDCGVLRRLPDRLLRDGLAEIIKHGILKDETIIDCFECGTILSDLEQVIEKNIRIKSWYVEADENDYGIRQHLNFGHTVGHALEKLSDFTLSHGQAVAHGMIAESRIAGWLGVLDGGTLSRIERMIGKITNCPMRCDSQAIVELIRVDKKSDGDNVHIILPMKIGDCALYSIGFDKMAEALCAIGAEI